MFHLMWWHTSRTESQIYEALSDICFGQQILHEADPLRNLDQAVAMNFRKQMKPKKHKKTPISLTSDKTIQGL